MKDTNDKKIKFLSYDFETQEAKIEICKEWHDILKTEADEKGIPVNAHITNIILSGLDTMIGYEK